MLKKCLINFCQKWHLNIQYKDNQHKATLRNGLNCNLEYIWLICNTLSLRNFTEGNATQYSKMEHNYTEHNDIKYTIKKSDTQHDDSQHINA